MSSVFSNPSRHDNEYEERYQYKNEVAGDDD